MEGRSRTCTVKYVNIDSRGKVVVALTEKGRLLPGDPEFADAVNEYIEFLDNNVKSGGLLKAAPMSPTRKKKIMAERDFFQSRGREIEKKFKQRKASQHSRSPLVNQNTSTVSKKKRSKTKAPEESKERLLVKKRKLVKKEEKESV